MGEGDLAVYKRQAAERGAWVCFVDETGQSLCPPKGRTWARRGQTPIVTVSGKRSGRVSVAGLVCVKPGHRTRLIYRTITFHGRKNEPKGFGVRDFKRLLEAAHQQLGGPLVIVWDNLPAHVCAGMRQFIDEHDWLMVVQLPSYAPELNPAEGIWANLKGHLANLAVRGGIDHLAAIIKHHLKRLQYRPDLLNAIIAQTELILEPEPP
ncbi:IS630 family transposase [Nonomuraea sp. K274]|uniref:IS630 family transposase n=1 Tax=Nonomuraea cypriaca TaxID=1187855 RepID=A0A931ATH6_9ACTN|nr:IS630 family transposase [Nonomuraea cypriaca]